MKFRNRATTKLSVTLAACLLAIAALTGCKEKEKEVKTEAFPEPKVDGDQVTFLTNAPQLSSLAVTAAQPRTLAVAHLTGRLYWNDETTVRIFTPVAGRVISVLADLGDSIKPGQALAEIDSPDFGQALANARTAAGNFTMADKALTRTKELLGHGGAAQKDVEAAEAAYAAALAEKDRANAVLANYGGSDKATNSLYLLRSPLGGVLVDKNINPGQELRADLMLANAPNLFVPQFVVSDPSQLWLQLDVAESDISSLKEGQQLRVRSSAFPDKVFEGVVKKVGGSMDPTTRTVKVRGVVDNAGGLLKAEMYVLVDVARDLQGTDEGGVEIPSKALFMKASDSYLFVEEAPGRYVRRRVTVGTEKDGKVPVFEGLKSGDKVVIEGALLLQAVIEPAG